MFKMSILDMSMMNLKITNYIVQPYVPQDNELKSIVLE